MRPGIGQNASCAVGDFTPRPAFLFREKWFVDCLRIQAEARAILASVKEAELQDSICTACKKCVCVQLWPICVQFQHMELFLLLQEYTMISVLASCTLI